MSTEKSPTTSKLSIPAEILDAARRVYQAGVPTSHANLAFGCNAQSFTKLVHDKGDTLYQAALAGRVVSTFNAKAVENLIDAHLALAAAQLVYRAALEALANTHTPNGKISNT